MKSARTAFVVTMIMLLGASTLQAEAWSFKKLVPSFGKSERPTRGLYSEPDKPSVWKRMNNGTKKLMAKTKKAVPPWLMPETQDRVRRSGSSFRRGTNRIKEEFRNCTTQYASALVDSRRTQTPSNRNRLLGATHAGVSG